MRNNETIFFSSFFISSNIWFRRDRCKWPTLCLARARRCAPIIHLYIYIYFKCVTQEEKFISSELLKVNHTHTQICANEAKKIFEKKTRTRKLTHAAKRKKFDKLTARAKLFFPPSAELITTDIYHISVVSRTRRIFVSVGQSQFSASTRKNKKV